MANERFYDRGDGRFSVQDSTGHWLGSTRLSTPARDASVSIDMSTPEAKQAAHVTVDDVASESVQGSYWERAKFQGRMLRYPARLAKYMGMWRPFAWAVHALAFPATAAIAPQQGHLRNADGETIGIFRVAKSTGNVSLITEDGLREAENYPEVLAWARTIEPNPVAVVRVNNEASLRATGRILHETKTYRPAKAFFLKCVKFEGWKD